MMKLWGAVLILLMGGIGAVPTAWAEDFGRVVRLQGEAWVERDGAKAMLRENEAISREDQLVTGAGSRLLVALAEGGQLTLGENARLKVTVAIEESARSFRRLDVKGAFRMISGAANPVRKQEWMIGTQVATIGVRGTDFWGGSLDGELDVMVLSGRVEVISNGGRVILEPAQGTVVRNALAAPTPAKVWGTVKVERALATVSFAGN